MNRRGFLGLLGAAAAAMTLDPERALWVPGKIVNVNFSFQSSINPASNLLDANAFNRQVYELNNMEHLQLYDTITISNSIHKMSEELLLATFSER